jgi:hypothetical protein
MGAMDSMTDITRLAEKIIQIIYGGNHWHGTGEKCKDLEQIESLLREAMENNGIQPDDLKRQADLSYAAGEHNAYTRAAEVARKMYTDNWAPEFRSAGDAIGAAIEKLIGKKSSGVDWE